MAGCSVAPCPRGTVEQGPRCIPKRQLEDASLGASDASGDAEDASKQDAAPAIGARPGPRRDAGAAPDLQDDAPNAGPAANDAGRTPPNDAGPAPPQAAPNDAGPAPEGSAGSASRGAICGDGVREAGELCDGADCPASCDDGDPCTRDIRTGSPEQCNVACSQVPVTEPARGDACCPAAANANTDDDCPPRCGNGVAEPGERCDGSNCPAACDDQNPCTANRLAGAATSCNAVCEYPAITQPMSGDGCCPEGADATADDDCSPTCGNGAMEPGETCDGNCPASCDDADPCTADLTAGTARQCNLACTHRDIVAPANGDRCCPDGANATNDDDCAPRCGNGVQEAGETCDGTCRRTCDDGVACTRDELTGSPEQCNVSCANPPITLAADGDGCCPPGANANTDDDCTAVCGNGTREPDEQCDPMAMDQVAGFSCDMFCRRLNRLTPCTDGTNGECSGSPPSVCDSGFCRPTCPTRTNGALCEPLPGATMNVSTCTGEPQACAWLCTVAEEDAYCGPSLWCDGTYCRVRQ